jgi:hypothetical protein
MKTSYEVRLIKNVTGNPRDASDEQPGQEIVYSQRFEPVYKGLETADFIELVNNKQAQEAVRALRGAN